MKHVSVKGLADFVSADPAGQRKIVRQFKYPREDESRAKIIYYREARDIIEAYCRGGRNVSWLTLEAAHLDGLAAMLAGRSRARLRHNARAIRAYATGFAARAFELLPAVRVSLQFGDVRVTVVPDLHVREKSKEKLIKLELGVDPPADTDIRVICQLMIEAAARLRLALPASCVLYLDVSRGIEHRGARAQTRVARQIEAASQTISDIWDRI